MKETKVKKDQIPINFNFISHKSFENYIVGKDNIIIEILKKSSNSESPSIVFLSGKKSSGKSHLCYAVISLSNKSTYFIDEFNVFYAFFLAFIFAYKPFCFAIFA